MFLYILYKNNVTSPPYQLQRVRGNADRGTNCWRQQSAHLQVRIASASVTI
jgi:hypothetical protein